MKKITQTDLEQATALIRRLSLKDFNRLREILGKEIGSARVEEAKISSKRAIEVLWAFYHDFDNEAKNSFSQAELARALRWILTIYGEHFGEIEQVILASNTGSDRKKHRADRLRRQAFLSSDEE